ncbi:ccr4 associated factor [Nowakowskiella sp. JEL0407]|nr:ccr4 associated factor [Nowakowskiella sp. JEL0407]
MTETLISHFKRYILRNKVHLSNVSDQYQTYQCWGPTTHGLWGSYVEPTAASKLPPGGLVAKERFCDVGTKDPRNSDMGLRILLPSNTTPKLPGNFRYVDYSDYTLRRLLLGVPEGVHDFFHNASLPLESNMDIMQGVDFRKGCYLGQELTIRTYHTGVTRKRIVPVQLIEPSNSFEDDHQYVDKSFDNRLPESQSEIRLDSQESQLASSRSTRTASGKFCQGMYNIGLALMRLDQISDSNGKPNVFTTENGLKLRAFVPDWWPGISH